MKQLSKRKQDLISSYQANGYTIIDGNNKRLGTYEKWKNFEVVKLCHSQHKDECRIVWAVKRIPLMLVTQSNDLTKIHFTKQDYPKINFWPSSANGFETIWVSHAPITPKYFLLPRDFVSKEYEPPATDEFIEQWYLSWKAEMEGKAISNGLEAGGQHNNKRRL